MVMVRVPPVETPVNSKLLVPGVAELPATNRLPNGRVPEPRSAPAAEPGRGGGVMGTLDRLDREVLAPPLLGQLDHTGAPAVDSRQRPGAPATNDEMGLVLLPRSTPSAASVAAPVPPWATLKAVVSPVSEVMSELAPEAAAPRLLRAPAAVLAPVPPFGMPSWPVNEMLPVALKAMLPEAETARVPEALGTVMG